MSLLPEHVVSLREFQGRSLLPVSKEWTQLLKQNDTNIINNAFKKYKTRNIIGGVYSVKDVYDVARAALDADDVTTVRDLMFTYTGYLPIEWCSMVEFSKSIKMINLFAKLGCKSFVIENSKQWLAKDPMFFTFTPTSYLIEMGYDPETFLNTKKSAEKVLGDIQGNNYLALYFMDIYDLIYQKYPDLIDDLFFADAVSGEYLHFLDRYVKPKQYLRLMLFEIRSEVVPAVPSNIYQFLEYKGFNWKWPAYYVEKPLYYFNSDGSRPRMSQSEYETLFKEWRKRHNIVKPPSTVWRSIVATFLGDKIFAFDYFSEKYSPMKLLLQNILEEHKEDITPEMMEKMKTLTLNRGDDADEFLGLLYDILNKIGISTSNQEEE